MIHSVDSSAETVPISASQQFIQRTLPVLERRVDEAIAGKLGGLDLVMSNVQIIDSAGLNWLLSVQGRLETLGIRLRLLDPSPIMADVLLATRLDSRFTVEVTTAPDFAGQENGANHAR
jgi:anti-anti-sigma factor